jgi:truncated hemoglobin YjbI
MTRTGKIARLPYSTIRDLLNQRLHNGEQGAKLVKWLNGLPEVQEVLTEEFGGRPISEQNLSEWKQGGFDDWLRHQETRAWVRALADESADLEEEAGDFSVADWLSAPLAVVLGRWIHELTAGAQNDPEQRRALLGAAREVNQLRRGDHEEQWLRIERERWQAEQAVTEAEKRSAAKMAPLATLLLARRIGDLYKEDLKKSGGKFPAELEAFFAATAKVRETKNGPGDCKPQEILQADQTESNPIQPNQTV